MTKRIEYRSENGWGFNALPMSISDDDLIPVKTTIILDVGFDNFFSGIKQFSESKEIRFRGIGKKENLLLKEIISEQKGKDNFLIKGIIEEKETGESVERIFLEVFAHSEKQITINIIQWYVKLNGRTTIPVYDEFSKYFRGAIYEKWRESRRQLSQFWDRVESDYDELVHEYSITTNAEKFIYWCCDEFSDGVKAKYTKIYEYYTKTPENIIKASIMPFSYPPDYKNPQWDFMLVSHDEVIDEKEYDPSFLQFRGEYNPILRIKVLDTINENDIYQCKIRLFRNRNFPYHNRLISIFCDNIEEAFNIDEGKRRKKTKRGMTYRTEDLIHQLRSLWKLKPYLRKNNKETLRVLHNIPGYQDITLRQIEYVKHILYKLIDLNTL